MYRRSQWRSIGLAALLSFGLALIGTTWPDRARAESSASENSQQETDSGEQDSPHETLTERLPTDSQFALFFDVDELRKSQYYSELESFIRDRMPNQKALSKLESEGGLDLSKDISGIALGFPAATPTAIRQSQKAAVVIRGEFNSDDLTSLVKDSFSEVETRDVSDDLTVHAVDQSDIAVMDEHIVIVSGDSSYRESAWKTVRGEGTSLRETIGEEKIFERVQNDRSFWVLNRAGGESRPQPLADLQSAVVSAHLLDGVDLQLVARSTSKEAGQKMNEQMTKLKKSSSENPMLRTVGAAPLVDNLEMSLDDTTFTATTSMNTEELDTLIASLKQLVQSRMQQQGGQPKGGPGKMGPGDSSSLPIPNEQKDPSEESSSDEGSASDEGSESDDGDDGVDADFN